MDVTVLLAGKLKGMSLEADCDLMAKRSPAKATGGFTYSDLRIIQAPANCPDGDYILTFDDHSVAATRKAGAWHLGKLRSAQDAESGPSPVDPPGASIRGAVNLIRLRMKRKPESAGASEKKD